MMVLNEEQLKARAFLEAFNFEMRSREIAWLDEVFCAQELIDVC